MKNVLITEFKKSMQSLNFKVAFTIIFAICMYQYIFICQYYEGDGLGSIRSAYELSIMTGNRTGFLFGNIVSLMPLLACFIYADSYAHDRKSNVLTSIVTRVSKKTYVIAKGIAVFVTAFVVFFVPLFINQLLMMVTFPQKGIDNKYASPVFDIGYTNYHPDYLFDLIRVEHPFAYNLIYMFLISLFAGLIALIGLVISFKFNRNRFIPIIIPFILYMFWTYFIEIVGLSEYSIRNHISPGPYAEGWQLIILIIALYVPIVIAYRKYEKSDML
jgi:hypothetical protein